MMLDFRKHSSRKIQTNWIFEKRFIVQSRDNRVKRASIAPTKLMHMILYQDDWQKISSSSSTQNELK